jgi:hypothetical protein
MLTIASALALILCAALSGYEIWFCASALHGDPGGCTAMSLQNLVAEPFRLAAVAMGVAGVLVGLRMSRK